MKALTVTELRALERLIAVDNTRVTLDSYGIPLEGGWKQLDWKYLKQTFGLSLYNHVRLCWNYARDTGLVEVRNRTEFRLKDR